MRKNRCYILVCLGSLQVLGGCDRSPSEFSVEYYETHPQERKDKVDECASDPGALRDDALCINAMKADASEAIGKWSDLPPMNLPTPDKRSEPNSTQED
jgi:hypothetical protein